MTIETELRSHLDRTLRASEWKDRNISLITTLYGFGEMFWPTLEEAGAAHGIRTRERVRQIDEHYRNAARGLPFPLARRASAIVSGRDFWRESELSEVLAAGGLIPHPGQLDGVFRHLQALELAPDHVMILPDLSEAGRQNYHGHRERFIMRRAEVPDLRRGLEAARKLQGQLGVVDFGHLGGMAEGIAGERLAALLRGHSGVWSDTVGGAFFYAFEDLDSVFINNCEKIFLLTDSCQIDLLAGTLENSLRRRSHPLAYPGTDAIKSYLGGSRHFSVDGDRVSFPGKAGVLTEIETAIVAYFRSAADPGGASWESLTGHLRGLGFEAPLTDKTVSSSPLIHIDRSRGRGYHRYHLVSSVPGFIPGAAPDDDALYRLFSERLRVLGAAGTDTPTEGTARREQGVLRAWLFGDAATACCALCEREMAVSALVAAHKRKRADCSEEERLDPHIVFPLCLFGCDYLYERGLVSVVNGAAAGDPEPRPGVSAGPAETARIAELHGRPIGERWLKGDADYFARRGSAVAAPVV